VRWANGEGLAFDLAARTPLWSEPAGGLTLTPSIYVDLAVDAQAVTTIPFPPMIFAGAVFPVGRARLRAEAHWLGWGSMNTYQSTVSDGSIRSSDDTTQWVLDAYGVSEPEFLEEVGASTVTTGMRSVVDLGVAASAPLGQAWEAGGGAWLLPAAVPDGYVHPGNLDFTMVDLRGFAAWTPRPWLTAGLSADWFYSVDRVIRDSLHTTYSPSPSGSLVPPGDGVYSLDLVRLGLTLVLRH